MGRKGYGYSVISTFRHTSIDDTHCLATGVAMMELAGINALATEGIVGKRCWQLVDRKSLVGIIAMAFSIIVAMIRSCVFATKQTTRLAGLASTFSSVA